MPVDPKAGSKSKDTQPIKEKDTKPVDNPSTGSTSSGRSKTSKIVIGCLVAALLVVGAVLIVKMNKDRAAENTASTQQEEVVDSGQEQAVEEPISEEAVNPDTPEGDAARPWTQGDGSSQGEVVEPSREQKTDGVVPGMKDIAGNTVSKNEAPVESDKFVKDLDGKAVAENFEIEEIYEVADFVSYKKHRAKTDAGVEIYWLDATYRGKKAKVQVSFSVFKELDSVGVVGADVEITRVKTGDETIQEIATYFKIREDYKEILNSNR